MGDEWDDVFQHPGILLPGIEQVSVICLSDVSRELTAVTRGKDGMIRDDHREITSTVAGKQKLLKFRSVNKPYEWIRTAESPLLTDPDEKKEPESDLFTEMQNTILVLRFRSEADSRYDVIMIYLNRNLNQFGGMLPDKVLSIENKSIIGHILYNYFRNIYHLNRQNNRILKSLQQSIRSVTRENYNLKEESRQMARTHEEMIIGLSMQYLQEQTEKYPRDYSFSDDAIEKLKTYRGNIRNLPAIIEQAVVFCENLLYFESPGPVKLDAMAISFDNFQVGQEPAVALKRIDSRESKTIQLLERLEKAALALQARGVALTGSNIGGALAQRVTAPAITDAIKKHRMLIIELLHKYPTKWETIRDGFRPIAKLLRALPADLPEEESA